MQNSPDRDRMRQQAEALGYRVRFCWLDGCGGGVTEIDGQRWLLVDDMLSPEQQAAFIRRQLAATAASSDVDSKAA